MIYTIENNCKQMKLSYIFFIYPSDLLKQRFEYAREDKCEKMKLS